MFQSVDMPSPDMPSASSAPQRMPDIQKHLRSFLRNKNAHLVLLRIGLGLGWLMASLGKLTDPAWHRGDALVTFLHNQLATHAYYMPFGEMIITDYLLPNAPALAWIIMISEWLVGLAIITGTLTNLALFLGILMNINLILVGAVNPSVLYIFIQSILYITDAGGSYSIDAVLIDRNRSIFFVVPPTESRKRISRSPSSRAGRSPSQLHEGASIKMGRNIFMGGRMKDSYLRNSY